jgi:hypothetical protein
LQGGLVIKHVLLASFRKNDALFRATAGAAFIGCPHTGSPFASKIYQHLSTAHRWLPERARSAVSAPFIASMQDGESNLLNLNEAFLRALSLLPLTNASSDVAYGSRRMAAVSLVEGLPMTVLDVRRNGSSALTNALSVFVVPAANARLGYGLSRTLDADHVQLCKASGVDDAIYIELLRFIEESVVRHTREE